MIGNLSSIWVPTRLQKKIQLPRRLREVDNSRLVKDYFAMVKYRTQVHSYDGEMGYILEFKVDGGCRGNGKPGAIGAAAPA